MFSIRSAADRPPPYPLAKLMALCNRGMAVEEQFRNTQGCHFEVRLEWTPFRTLASLVRVTRLVGVVPVLGTAFGPAVTTTAPRVRPPCKPKGRRLLLTRVGSPSGGELGLLISIGVRCLQVHLRPPRLLGILPPLSGPQAAPYVVRENPP
jgi:hypothetical protein